MGATITREATAAAKEMEATMMRQATDAAKVMVAKMKQIDRHRSGLGMAVDWVKSAGSGVGIGVKNMDKAYDALKPLLEKEIIQAMETADKAFVKTADELANEAIATALGKTVPQVEKAAAKISGRSMAKMAMGRTLYVLATRNLLVDIVKEANKKHDQTSSTAQALDIIMQMIQALMLMYGGMKGFAPGMSLDAMYVKLAIGLSVIQTLGMATTAGLEGSLANVDSQQAPIIQDLAKKRAASDGWQRLLSQQSPEINRMFDKLLKDLNADLQSNANLARKVVSDETTQALMRLLNVSA